MLSGPFGSLNSPSAALWLRNVRHGQSGDVHAMPSTAIIFRVRVHSRHWRHSVGHGSIDSYGSTGSPSACTPKDAEGRPRRRCLESARAHGGTIIHAASAGYKDRVILRRQPKDLQLPGIDLLRDDEDPSLRSG